MDGLTKLHDDVKLVIALSNSTERANFFIENMLESSDPQKKLQLLEHLYGEELEEIDSSSIPAEARYNRLLCKVVSA